MLSHQNASGITLLLRRSLAIHWTIKRALKSACPRNPTTSQSLEYTETSHGAAICGLARRTLPPTTAALRCCGGGCSKKSRLCCQAFHPGAAQFPDGNLLKKNSCLCGLCVFAVNFESSWWAVLTGLTAQPSLSGSGLPTSPAGGYLKSRFWSHNTPKQSTRPSTILCAIPYLLLPVRTRSVSHRNLDHAEPSQGNEGGKKAVHPGKPRYVLDALPVKGAR